MIKYHLKLYGLSLIGIINLFKILFLFIYCNLKKNLISLNFTCELYNFQSVI